VRASLTCSPVSGAAEFLEGSLVNSSQLNSKSSSAALLPESRMHIDEKREEPAYKTRDDEAFIRLSTKFKRSVLLRSRVIFIDIQSTSPACICFEFTVGHLAEIFKRLVLTIVKHRIVLAIMAHTHKRRLKKSTARIGEIKTIEEGLSRCPSVTGRRGVIFSLVLLSKNPIYHPAASFGRMVSPAHDLLGHILITKYHEVLPHDLSFTNQH
jgi:hypothetical protein